MISRLVRHRRATHRRRVDPSAVGRHPYDSWFPRAGDSWCEDQADRAKGEGDHDRDQRVLGPCCDGDGKHLHGLVVCTDRGKEMAGDNCEDLY